jgi:anti-sigma B factor antagonist
MAADACDTTSVQLDMSGVDFIDSSGLSVLVSGDRHLRRSGGGLTVVNPSASVASLLALTALEVRIDLCEGAS